MTAQTVAAPAPVEVVTPIKPSEALRLGRLIRSRRVPSALLTDRDGACALGVMAITWGWDGTDENDGYQVVLDRFGFRATDIISETFDSAEYSGRDGDAAVLAYLEERGL